MTVQSMTHQVSVQTLAFCVSFPYNVLMFIRVLFASIWKRLGVYDLPMISNKFLFCYNQNRTFYTQQRRKIKQQISPFCVGGTHNYTYFSFSDIFPALSSNSTAQQIITLTRVTLPFLIMLKWVPIIMSILRFHNCHRSHTKCPLL